MKKFSISYFPELDCEIASASALRWQNDLVLSSQDMPYPKFQNNQLNVPFIYLIIEMHFSRHPIISVGAKSCTIRFSKETVVRFLELSAITGFTQKRNKRLC